MSEPARIGVAAGPHLVEIEVDSNTRTGEITTRRATGVKSEIDSLRDTLIFAPTPPSHITMRPTGTGLWELRWEYPYNEYGTTSLNALSTPNIYELEVEIAMPSIYQSPKLNGDKEKGIEAKLTPQIIGAIQRIVIDYLAGKYNGATPTTAQENAEIEIAKIKGPSGEQGDWEINWGIMLFRAAAIYQQSSFIQYRSVFRRTISTGIVGLVNASYEGEGKIWTTDEVEDWEGIVDGGWFRLKDNSQWLKSPPQVLAAAGSKTNLVYTYTECKQASMLTYEPYKSAQLFTFGVTL